MIESSESQSNRWVAIELWHDEFDEVGLCAHKTLICLRIYQQGDFRAALIPITCKSMCVISQLAAGKHLTSILTPDSTPSSVMIVTGPLVASML